MKPWLALVILAVGVAIGVFAARLLPDDAAPAPDGWIAQVGDGYLTAADWETEVRMRGGERSGRFVTADQRQALMDQLLYRRALVERAERAGIHLLPEVRRSLDQILINQVLQSDLRPRQEGSDISDEAVAAFYDEHAQEYVVPARRRIAMIHFELGALASEETRETVRATAEDVLARTDELPPSEPGFGTLAREHSAHQASRFRGGVLGWVGEGDASRYSHPQVVVETANGMDTPGTISGIVEDERGLYLVRLVNYEPERVRPLEELADGIRQRLMRDRFRDVETAFREETLAAAAIEINARGRELLEATGEAPAEPEPETPPSLPGMGTGGN